MPSTSTLEAPVIQPSMKLPIGALVVAIVPSAAWLALFLFANTSAAGFGIFILSVIVTAGIYLFWMVRSAGKISSSTALSCYTIPFYFLYFVYGMSDSKYLKAATVPYLVSIGLLLILFFGPKPNFPDPAADFERQMAQPIPRQSP